MLLRLPGFRLTPLSRDILESLLEVIDASSNLLGGIIVLPRLTLPRTLPHGQLQTQFSLFVLPLDGEILRMLTPAFLLPVLEVGFVLTKTLEAALTLLILLGMIKNRGEVCRRKRSTRL